ncbi:hypothetical protein F3N42_01625 [Marinihelvus fidelis]|uniref:Esterase-like activity of phytase family protein n=1 Tax=Marinihelvus fidelis TaxID=2613842 RepID=A0A5N0TG38_9GAMM|nr:hypothetical protein [Marinihelvus fidelis]KAA9133087.1 hypothetical protein F3N42_01625 [Marinihelvus fidelis]
MKTAFSLTLCLLVLAAASGCERVDSDTNPDIRFRESGPVQNPELDEISGLQASLRNPGVLWVHNDDGPARVFALGADGSDLGYFDIHDAVNVDWEDIALVPGARRDLLVLADVGDNHAARERTWLYLVEEPKPDEDGRFSGTREAFHWISLSYPDGPRDTESISWDPVGQRLLVLSKRDLPPRLYAIDANTLLTEKEAELEFLGEIDRFRAPTAADKREFGKRTPWVSQPTGMDISADGRRAAVLTYRSLYLFERGPDMDWLQGLGTEPVEIIGPPGAHDEVVGFGSDSGQLWIGTEGEHPPVWEFRIGAE